MNMFQSRGVTVLIDYGHNVPAMLAIQNVIQRTPHQRRIVVCAGTGSRTDDTLIAFGRAIGAFYSRVHLRDSDPRRRTIGETTDYVRKGLDQEGMDMANVIDHGASEFDAIAAALNEAKEGDFVHLQVDDVDGSVAQVQAWRRSREVQEPSA
jgi:cyanophycin synthetase